MGCRHADRTAAVRPVGQRHDAGCDACCGAPARSAGTVREVPRIVRRPIKYILGTVDKSHLGHVGDAHEDKSGPLQCREEGSSSVGNPRSAREPRVICMPAMVALSLTRNGTPEKAPSPDSSDALSRALSYVL
jgi:hypothetical protein